MATNDLPDRVRAELNRRLDGVKRDRLVRAAQSMSAIYRDGGHSDQAVASADAALAYAVARMPATFAATLRAMRELADGAPDFAPQSMLDLGAGPGTATLAARTLYSAIETALLIEPNRYMRDLAAAFVGALSPAAAQRTTILSDAAPTEAHADLVVLSYVLAEQASTTATSLVERAVRLARHAVVVVEPGRPSGYERILAARRQITAAGFHLVAPCPHAATCPLKAPDWCHFSIRLPRSRDHRSLKDADLPYEDEPFSYLVATRDRLAQPRPPRVLRPPVIRKADVTMHLCTLDGLQIARLPRSDKALYKAAKSVSWGDTFVP